VEPLLDTLVKLGADIIISRCISILCRVYQVRSDSDSFSRHVITLYDYICKLNLLVFAVQEVQMINNII
jgi:hypothetical protein